MSEDASTDEVSAFELLLRNLDAEIVREMDLSYSQAANVVLNNAFGTLDATRVSEQAQLLLNPIQRASLIIKELINRNAAVRNTAQSFEVELKAELAAERAESKRLRSEIKALKAHLDFVYKLRDRERFSEREASKSAEKFKSILSDAKRLLDERNNFLSDLMSTTSGLLETLEDAEEILTHDASEDTLEIPSAKIYGERDT